MHTTIVRDAECGETVPCSAEMVAGALDNQGIAEMGGAWQCVGSVGSDDNAAHRRERSTAPHVPMIGANNRRQYAVPPTSAGTVTDVPGAIVGLTVKSLAEPLTEQHGKNQYQGIYNERSRRFGVNGYKLIQREKYDAVLAFLEDWRNAAIKGKQLPDGEEQ